MDPSSSKYCSDCDNNNTEIEEQVEEAVEKTSDVLDVEINDVDDAQIDKDEDEDEDEEEDEDEDEDEDDEDEDDEDDEDDEEDEEDEDELEDAEDDEDYWEFMECEMELLKTHFPLLKAKYRKTTSDKLWKELLKDHEKAALDYP